MSKAEILKEFLVVIFQFVCRLGTLDSAPDIEPIIKVTPQQIDEAKAAAEQFLLAPDLDSLAPLIRDQERVMPLVRKHYKSTPYKPAGIQKRGFEAPDSQIADRFLSFKVVLGDFSEKPIAVEVTPEGPKIDWESWVAYCETPWDQFIETKPPTPNKVRVLVKKDTYYNFAFSDEEKWQCFRLVYPHSDEVLYGYLPADSELLAKMPKESKESESLQIRIHFTNEPKTANQVLISEPIAAGWVSDLSSQ